MKYIIFLLIYLLMPLNGNSQMKISKNLEGGGEIAIDKRGECLSQSKREALIKKLYQKRKVLRNKGLLAMPQKMAVSFIWPIKQAPGFTYNSTYRITNFVDHDSDFPDELRDYNCGERSYDTEGGYNHRGIDIALHPFKWHQVLNSQTQIIAAASGTIINKDDGNFDANCSFNDGDWNAVYVEHGDGSIAWYGHMKKNSLTNKDEGDFVAAGEYLGAVGSSGNSTGPHLHFEVYDNDGDLIDPFAGPCNSLNNSSWWADQKPYREPTINAIFTHTAEPEYPDCPGPATTNISTEFDFGDVIYFTIFLHDQLDGTTALFKIFAPDNTLFSNWSRNFTSTLTSSYWFSTRVIPCDGLEGTWKYEVSYEGDVVTHFFNVGTCPNNRTLNQTVPNGTTTGFRASNKITAKNIIEANTCVTIAAGNEVRLKNGFHAKQGSDVHIFIRDCDDNFAIPASLDFEEDLVASEDEKEDILIEIGSRSTSKHHSAMKVFPNPFIDKFQLNYDHIETGPASIILVNSRGQLLQFIMENDDHQAGEYQLEVKVPLNLAGEILFIIYKQKNKTEIRKISHL